MCLHNFHLNQGFGRMNPLWWFPQKVSELNAPFFSRNGFEHVSCNEDIFGIAGGGSIVFALLRAVARVCCRQIPPINYAATFVIIHLPHYNSFSLNNNGGVYRVERDNELQVCGATVLTLFEWGVGEHNETNRAPAPEMT